MRMCVCACAWWVGGKQIPLQGEGDLSDGCMCVLVVGCVRRGGDGQSNERTIL